MTIPILRRAALVAALVAAAVVPGVPAYAAGTGAIAGTVTTSSGAAAPDVAVQIYHYDNGDTEAVGWTQQRQFVPGKLTYEAVGVFDLQAGGQLTADDTVLPTGTLAGRLTTATGTASVGAAVTATPVDGHDFVTVLTNANGEFSLPLFATGYVVSFYQDRLTQYYPGKTNHADATEVRVLAGQTTRITDSWLGTGSVRITGVDAVSGAPVADFCAEGVCSNSTGKVTVIGQLTGSQRLNANPADVLHFDTDVDVQVRADQTVDVTARFAPGAAISTRIVDRATGNPVAGVCLDAFLPKQVRIHAAAAYCSNAEGRVTAGPLVPGLYRLFATPTSATHGKQWVGAAGGTGDERQAATVAAVAGRISTAPQVVLDPAGSIVGRVTDAATGQPLAGVRPGLVGPQFGQGDRDPVTDPQGNYRLDRLGPYEWPVVFSREDMATTWSGGTGDRYAATKVKVPPGASTSYLFALTRGTEVKGTLKNAAGVSAAGGYLAAHNAVTGDIVGVSVFSDGGYYSMRLVAGQSVYFTYNTDFDGRASRGQYPEPATVRSTRPGGPTLATAGFPVPSSGPLTIDITVRTG
ncbi:carboxypeptidase regulatory-like domain-containing protein [Micromonospora sp. CPCC 206060]|uniref:carboxypeptidase regulatory-like domain-containing protein n=1 Tax=Micromonospora sp. CPCC 206060 TaxID=3122406 RepID=UPI002FF1D5FE